jgi:integrase
MAERITDAAVRNMVPPASGNRIVYDSEIVGFGVRITKAGAKSFVLNYRAEGRERRLTIGRYPAWSVERARKEAKELRRRVDAGADPLAKREADRGAPTVGDLCDRYTEEHLPRKRASSARNDKAMIAQIVRPKLGSDKVGRVSHSDIDRLHRSLKATPYRANRVLALLGKMFVLARKWGWRGDNPAEGVERFPESKRNRYLSGAEMTRLAVVLAAEADKPAANIVRLLLLTGARSGEVRGLKWSQLDLEAGVWIKPGATTKQKTEHRVPLSDGAAALLREIHGAAPRDDEGVLRSDLVFPSRAGGVRGDIKKQWAAIAIAAGLYDVEPGTDEEGKPIEVKRVNCRIHDLRHTYASVLVSAGLSLPIIGALLGHTQPQTTARYAHLMDDPLRQATNRAADVILGKPAADPVPIREGVA